MAHAVFRKPLMMIAAALAAGLTVPAAAQSFSEGYQFLKAVRDGDGDAATSALNEPGSTIVNSRDISTGESALHIVTERRDALWIRFLSQRGANPNLRDKNGTTPLQLAVNLGFLEGVEALIAAGADLEVSNVAGETPLISAVHQRNLVLIRMLLANGADPDRSDNSGRSARDYVAIIPGNARLLAEFEKADDLREGEGNGASYGPSL